MRAPRRFSIFVSQLLAVILIAAGLHAQSSSNATAQSEREQAIALFKEKKRAEAKVIFEKLLRQHPQDAEIHYYLAVISAMADDWKTAIPHAEKSVEKEPTNAEYHFGLGQACGLAALKSGMISRLGYAKRCRAAYERAIELNPKHALYRTQLIQFYMLAPAMIGGGMDKAHAQANEIKKFDPISGAHAAHTIYSREKKYSEAFKELEDSLKTKPDDYLTHFLIGRLAAISGQRLDEGLAALQRCLDLSVPPDAPQHANVHWRRGNLFEKKGDVEAARRAYEASLALNPNFSNAKDAVAKLPAPK